ncbi:MAG: translation initiation factor IF-2 [Candidatus Kerfeldbacteria bacterium]
MALATAIKKPVQLPQRISVKALAERLSLPLTQVMTELVKNGVMAAMNEEIDFDTAAIVADDLGFTAELEKQTVVESASRQSLSELIKETDESKLVERSPVVVVMGHVDHGKTKLLDAIRKTNVTASEAGGITQHIGAYQVVEKGQTVTFIDTPGHEAFTAMRSRGARVADVAILVVAADDGVKPQTEEAIRIINEARLPFVVAINKVDKPESNPARVKQELAAKNVLVEEFGGKTVCVEVSAKQVQGIKDLLDSVLLVTQVEKENLKANPDRPAIGTIIESHVDSGEGPVATVLVHTGTLKVGDFVSTEDAWGRIKALRNYRGDLIDEAGPSVPARILGLKGAPSVGDTLRTQTDPKVIRELKSKKVVTRRSQSTESATVAKKEDDATKGVQTLPLVIRADTLGSLEAIKESLAKLSHPEVRAEIVQGGLGNITEADVLRAETAQAKLVGFNVVSTPAAESVARGKNMTMTTYDVIYDLVDAVRAALEKMLKPEIIETELGKVKILAVFRTESKSQIIGGKVISGKIIARSLLRVTRGEQAVAEGKLTQLQSQKSNVAEVITGHECGMKFEGPPVVQIDDVVTAFSREIKARHIGG